VSTDLHYDLYLTLADGTDLRLHQNFDAVAVPRREELIGFEMLDEAGAVWNFRVSRVDGVIWGPDGTEAVIVSRGMDQIRGEELQWFLDQGWKINFDPEPSTVI